MIGQKLADRYELVAELGKGGMGVVYLARDPVLDREVAVKTLHPGYMSQESEERLRREAQVVAKMDHPSITPVFDLGQHGGVLFLVMPVLTGQTLRQLLDERSLSLGDALRVLVQVAEALDYSHARGVIHRDVKPENVMVTRERQEMRVRVMDFGLARDPSTRASLTHSGGVLGTLAYMSPEQIQALPIDHRADLYSLGAVLFECLTGRPPFSGPVHRLIVDIAQDEAPALSEHIDVDAELEQLTARCLSKTPELRPANGLEIATVLRDCLMRLGGDALEQALAARPVAPVRRSVTPILGRDGEVAEVVARLESASAGECQLVLIDGEVGVGKTRLLEEVGRLAEARGVKVLRGRVADRQDAPPYQAFCELVQDYFRGQESSPRASSVVADLSDLAGELVARFPIFGEIEVLREQAGAPPEAPAEEEGIKVYELFARLLLRLAAGRPMVILLENLHLGDASIAALSYVVRRLGASPTLVAATFRTSEVDRGHPMTRFLHDLGQDPRTARLTLGPLGRESLRTLVDRQLPAGEISDQLVDRLQKVSEGNPLFAIELIKSLRSSDEIRRDRSGVWVIDERAGLGGDHLPRTIQQAVERHVERLPESHQRFLQLASVIGRSFDLDDLEALAEGSFDADTVADELVLEGLLTEDRRARGDRLLFSSGLVREVLERQVPRRRRRRLHRLLAQRLESRLGDGEPTPRLLHHCAEGDLAAETVRYGFALARRAEASVGYAEAIRAATTALDFVDDDEIENAPLLRGRLRALLARAERGRGGLNRSLIHGEKAVRELRELDSAAAALAAAVLAETAWQARRVEDVRRYLEAGLELARASPHEDRRTRDALERLLTLGATVANLRGEHRLARRYLEESESVRTAEAVEAPEIGGGGRLVFGMAAKVEHLDPALPHSNEEAEIGANVFETLLVAEDGHPAPGLAGEWAEVDGVFTVRLRSGLSFSDGTPLSAELVRRSLERAARRSPAGSPAALSVLKGFEDFKAGRSPTLAGLEVEGEDVLRFTPRQSLPIFPALLTHHSTAVVSEQDGRLLGTGPYRLAESPSGEKERSCSVLEASPRWRGERPRLGRVEFRSGVAPAALVDGLKSGELDVVRDLFPEDLEKLLRDSRFRSGLVEAPQNNLYFMLFNEQGPHTKDVRLRRALAASVRPEDLVWRALGRFARPAVSLIPPGLLGHDAGRRRGYSSPREVRSMLAAAGYPNGLRLRGAVHPLLRDRYGFLTLRLLDEWRGLGIELDIEELSLDELRRAYVENRDLDVLISRWIADVDDPDDFTYGFFHGEAGRFRHWFSDGAADQQLEAARRERDPALRIRRYRRFETLLDERAALVPLFHDLHLLAASPEVRGLGEALRPPYLRLASLARSSPPTTSTESPGGELQVALPGRLLSLDPTGATLSEAVESVSLIFETLTRVEEGAHTVPWLAESVTTEEDGRRFVIELRDARFHGGRRLTARDVRWSFERLLRTPKPAIHHLLLPIEGARQLRDGENRELRGLRILSERRLELVLERPLPIFPTLLSHPLTAVVPEGTHEVAGSWRDSAAGTGPFRVLHFASGSRLDLERNPDYWRPEAPAAERLTFQFGVSAAEVAQRYREGRLSLASDLKPSDIESFRLDPRFAAGYREQPRLATYFLALNLHHGPLRQRSVRRRLARCLAPDSSFVSAAGRLAIPAPGLIPPGLLGASDGPPELAGGESEGGEKQSLRVVLHPVFVGQYSSFWRRLQERASAAGFFLEADVLTPDQGLERARAGTADLLAYRWVADYPDTEGFIGNLLHSDEGSLAGICSVPQADELIERGRREINPGLRHAIYRELELLIAEQAMVVPLFHEQIYRFCHPTVGGFRFGTSTPEVRYDQLFVRR